MALGGNSNRSYLKATATGLALAVAIGQPVAAYAAAPYQVSAKPLAQALMELSREANVDIVAPAKITRGKMSAGVASAGSVPDALRQMLAGTGLTFRAKGKGFIIEKVRSVAGQPDMAYVQTASAQAGPPPARRVATGRGTIVGQVLDAESGRRLAGAQVRVQSTGEKAVTNDLGEFAFKNVPAGPATIVVSFLGYPEEVRNIEVDAGGSVAVDVVIGAGNDIVVFGSASARALAINRERTADNSQTVVSSDHLGDFQGTTISDALRRASGVAFTQDRNTGEGGNIIVRGLSADYNKVNLNGIPLPVSDGASRGPNLNNILADSISEVVINKTLLPSQDSAGTGGLVDIRTKSPLDRPRRYASAGAEIVNRGKGYGEDYLLSGTLSARFGASDNFGVSFSAQYRKQDVTNNRYGLSNGSPGYWVPLDVDGQVAFGLGHIDPRTPFPFEDSTPDYLIRNVDTGSNWVSSKTLTTTASAEWQVSDVTNLQLDYLRSSRTQDTLSRNFSLQANTGLAYRAIPELGGEFRYAWRVFDVQLSHAYQANLDEKNVTDSVALRFASKAGALDIDASLGFVKGKQETPSYISGAFNNRGVIPAATALLPEAFNPRTNTYSSAWMPRTGSDYPLPLLSESSYAALQDGSSYGFGFMNSEEMRGGSDTKYVAKGSLKYNLTSDIVKYVELGGSYDRSRFKSFPNQFSTQYTGTFSPVDGRRPTLESLGISVSPFSIGSYAAGAPSIALLDFDGLLNYARNYQDILARFSEITVEDFNTNPLLQDRFTREEDIALYAQAKLQFGRLEIFGGARMARVKVTAANQYGAFFTDENGVPDLALTDRFSGIELEKKAQTDILPRVLANFRASDNLVFRAGYYSSVARPQLGLLSASTNIGLNLQPRGGPEGNQPTLTIFKGNPGLKPAYTHNFDFSAEHYSSNIGAIKAGVFYKIITNFLETNRTQGFATLDGVTLPDDPRFQPDNLPDNIFIVGSTPFNNSKAARIWGAELSVDRQLDFLPGLLSGLGVFGNITYTKSEKQVYRTWFNSPIIENGVIVGREQVNWVEDGKPFNNQPKLSWTAGLRYNKGRIDASLLYSRQSRIQVSSGADFGLDPFIEPNDTLDMRVEYRWKGPIGDIRFYVAGNDLLKDKDDPTLRFSLGGADGVPKIHDGATYLGGRRLTLGVTAAF